MKEVINIIGKTMTALGLKFSLAEYAGDNDGIMRYPYFVGSYMEAEASTEDGLQESTFTITGFARGAGAWAVLEEAKDKIRKSFPPVSGRVGITSSGSAVAIFYSNSLVIPTGDAELKSIEINLNIKEWKVN